jgi:hypothetical protein
MADLEPVVLLEDEKTGDRFLVYGTDKGVRLDIRYEGETLWMTQPQIAELFGVTRQSANSHLNNIYEEGEPDREATCKEFLQVRAEGGREVTSRGFERRERRVAGIEFHGVEGVGVAMIALDFICGS